MASEHHSPLDQFKITRPFGEIELYGVDVSFTNSSLLMLVSVLLISLLFLFSTRKSRSLIPGRILCISEMMYELVAKTVKDNIGDEGRAFFPFVLTLFMFILFCNFLGLIPYSFTVTSHIIVTFAFAIFIFIGVVVLGLIKHGLKFFTLFVPKGVPIFIAPLMVVIEFISYLSRPVSLSVRLAANMMAGHTMIKVFAMFVVSLGIYGFAPLIFIVLLYGLESIIAFLQAYVFAVLTCLYIHDSMHLH